LNIRKQGGINPFAQGIAVRQFLRQPLQIFTALVDEVIGDHYNNLGQMQITDRVFTLRAIGDSERASLGLRFEACGKLHNIERVVFEMKEPTLLSAQ
jgi:hypothetical protein